MYISCWKLVPLYSLINALNQSEVEVVSGLMWSACIVYEHQSGGICLPHLNSNTNKKMRVGDHIHVSSLTA